MELWRVALPDSSTVTFLAFCEQNVVFFYHVGCISGFMLGSSCILVTQYVCIWSFNRMHCILHNGLCKQVLPYTTAYVYTP